VPYISSPDALEQAANLFLSNYDEDNCSEVSDSESNLASLAAHTFSESNQSGSEVASDVASCVAVKLGIRTETSGPKSCEALASTCRLRCSLDGCLKFWRSGRSRRVRSQAEKKLKKDESELRRSRLLS